MSTDAVAFNRRLYNGHIRSRPEPDSIMAYSSSSNLFLVDSDSENGADCEDRSGASNVVWVPFGLRRARAHRFSGEGRWSPEPPPAA
jgi:hypothetical protein